MTKPLSNEIVTRVVARLHGRTIGWYDDAEQAQAALDAAAIAEGKEEDSAFAAPNGRACPVCEGK